MDLLFKRYASPFLLLDNMIQCGQLYDFVLELFRINNEDTLFDIWLHKVDDQSFDEFKKSAQVSVQNKPVSKEQLVTTIQDSKSLLDGFIPV